jgi:hypothetical protein
MLVSGRSARAENANAEGGEAKVIARGKALEGTRLADEGQHERAIELFREAYAIYPEPAYLYDMGVELQALGRDAQALDAYRRFLADPRNTPRTLVSHASDLQAELEKKLGEVQLRGAPDGAEIAIDDEPRGTAPLRERMRASPGRHRLFVRQLGYEPFQTDIDVPQGGTVAVDVPAIATPTAPVGTAETTQLPFLTWSVAAGAGFWTAGPPPGSGPSPAFSLGVARPLVVLPGDVAFELGAKLGFTYVTEPAATDTFLSVLVNARAAKMLNRRWRAFADIGAGLLVLGGLPQNSKLLERAGGRVTGALSAFELRPAIGASYAFADDFAIYIAPALIWNPSPSERFADASLTRFEVGFGVMGGF